MSNFALKTHYKVFQHKLLFNLVKDLFKWIEGLGRSVTVWVQSKRRRFSNLVLLRIPPRLKISLLYEVKVFSRILLNKDFRAQSTRVRCQISRHIVFQHKLLFNLVKDLFKWIEGLERSVTGPSTVWQWKNFWPRWYTKKVLATLSNFALKTHYIVFQHKLLFNLVKDWFKWIEGLGRSVTVWVQSNSEDFWPSWYTKKVLSTLIRCQMFQHKLLFNLVENRLGILVFHTPKDCTRLLLQHLNKS